MINQQNYKFSLYMYWHLTIVYKLDMFHIYTFYEPIHTFYLDYIDNILKI